jgi:hypothetical protein
MAPQLTEQQMQALHETDDAGPVTVVDPITDTSYILVRADVFQELQDWMQDLDPKATYPQVDRIMASDDAHDPTLATYQDDASCGKPA